MRGRTVGAETRAGFGGLLALLGLCTSAGAAVESQPTIDPLDMARPSIRVYTDQDGLPENSIFDIEIDARGYLWVATENGPAFYDGRRWRPLELPAGVRSRFVRAVLPTSDGSVWLAMEESGLLRHRNGAWAVYDRAHGFVADGANDLVEQPRPGATPLVWVATSNGLVRFDGEQWQVFDAAVGLHERTVTRLALAHDGESIWVGTRKGVTRFHDGHFDPAVMQASGASMGTVSSLFEAHASDGTPNLWAAFASDGPKVYRQGAWHAVLGSNLRGFALQASPTASGDLLWMGTYGDGLLQLRDGRWRTFDSAWGLPSDVIRSLRESVSAEGRRTLWIGTQGGGLVRMNQFGWRALDQRHGLPSNQVRRIAETHDADGQISLWIATNRGIARLRDGAWTYHGSAQALGAGDAHDLLVQRRVDGSEVLWAALGTHVARYADGRWRVWGPQDGLSGNVNLLASIGEDDEGQIYVGSWGGGLMRFEGDRVVRVDDGTGRFDRIQTIATTPTADGSRILWLVTGRGLLRRERGEWIDPAVNAPLPILSPTTLMLTWNRAGQRRLWVGGRGSGGPYTLEIDLPGAVWRNLRERVAEPLPESTIELEQGSDGQIYLFGTRGVVRLVPVADGQNAAHEYAAETFTTHDGLPSNRVNYNGSFIDHRGRVWAGTLGGAAFFDPATHVADRTPKPFYIDHAEISPGGLALQSGAVLEHDQNNVRFQLALLSTFREGESMFRSELGGFDTQPSKWTNEAHRDITNLPAGAYTFRAWGRDWAGNVSGPAELAFRIRPPWWNWWGAYLVYALGLAALGWAAVRSRTLRLRARAAELSALVDARTGELRQSNADLERSKHDVENAHARLLNTQQQLVLQEKMAALGTLTAGVAHEINNPTNFADGAVQELQTQLIQLHQFLRDLAGADAPPRVLEAIAARFDALKEMTSTAREGHERIKRIVRDLRQFTRLDEAERKSVPIADPIQSTVNLVRTRYDRIHFDLDLDYNPSIECQPAKLGQVFMNLVVNACQAIGECKDGREGVVRIATRPGADAIEISIADNGAGMDEATRQHVFEPFFTTKEVGSGTGLGLAIVFGIIRDHNGSIDVESTPGQGTRFVLRLPSPAARA